MIGLAFEFPLGRYHATDWGTHVNEAQVDWPPSPWRLLRALTAAACEEGGGTPAADAAAAITRIARAPAPGFELPPVADAHTRHYLPLRDRDKTALVLDAFVAFGTARELRAWWAAPLEPDERAALARIVGRVRHLGRSESLCDARLLEPDARPERIDAGPLDDPGSPEAGEVERRLACDPAAEDPLAVLRTEIGAMRAKRRTVPVGSVAISYRVALPASPQADDARVEAGRPTLAVLRVVSGSRPPLSDAVTLATVVRAALQRRFDAPRDGRRSATFSGRDGDRRRTDQHRHAHYLVLPDRGSARGDRVAVWAPEGLGPEELEALARLRTLRLRELPDPLTVGLVGLGDEATSPVPELTRAAREWESLTPFVLPRHVKPGRSADLVGEQVRTELAHRGLPAPERIEPVARAWSTFARDRPGQHTHRHKAAVGLRLVFAEPIPGPLALGANAHFGLGLFRPIG